MNLTDKDIVEEVVVGGVHHKPKLIKLVVGRALVLKNRVIVEKIKQKMKENNEKRVLGWEYTGKVLHELKQQIEVMEE